MLNDSSYVPYTCVTATTLRTTILEYYFCTPTMHLVLGLGFGSIALPAVHEARANVLTSYIVRIYV